MVLVIRQGHCMRLAPTDVEVRVGDALFTDSINCDDEAISRRTQRCASESIVERRAFAVHQGARVRVSEESH